jgi:hypothetical protein
MPTVGKWRRRFLRQRIAGLLDAPRVGAPRKISDVDVETAIRTTLESRPKDATHWSTRSLARKLGLSQSTVSRMSRAFGFAPIGPYLVTADQVDPDDLTIECRVNGETRQSSSTSDFIFGARQMVSYISQYFTLAPILFT